MNFIYRLARLADVDELLVLENQCFETDRLNARNFHWMVSRANARLIVAQADDRLMGYALVLFHRGTSLGRLYSLAINDQARGQGLGERLLAQAERQALEHDCAYLRLEVRADNASAIRLYERNGYRLFDHSDDYYEDHAPALRYEKLIRERATGIVRQVPRYAIAPLT
jgi:ribosomal-protein-alanine acetyltransferase